MIEKLKTSRADFHPQLQFQVGSDRTRSGQTRRPQLCEFNCLRRCGSGRLADPPGGQTADCRLLVDPLRLFSFTVYFGESRVESAESNF